MMSPTIKQPAVYKIDDLFKDKTLVYDKESDDVFLYIRKVHRQLIIDNPNNYRVAHRGDISL